MGTIKLLHTADIHIGAAESFLGFSADKRRLETLLTFEKNIDLAKDEKVDIIAISGDLFDSNQIEDRFIDAVFEKIAKAAPIKVVFAAGNHDPLTADSPFFSKVVPQNLYVLETSNGCISFEDIGLKVYGRSFDGSYLKGEAEFGIKADNDYICLMVQHGELKSDLNSDYNSITPNFIKTSMMDYIALGHVHKRSDIAKLGNSYFAYSGCPEGQGFDELDQKGVYIGEIGKGVCLLEFKAISKRQHIHLKINIEQCDSAYDISSLILTECEKICGQAFRENLYKIELIGELSPDFELSIPEISARLCEELYFVKIKDSTELAIDLDLVAKEPSLKGIFVRKMLEKQQAAEPEQKYLYEKALKLGLRAFTRGVKYSED